MKHLSLVLLLSFALFPCPVLAKNPAPAAAKPAPAAPGSAQEPVAPAPQEKQYESVEERRLMESLHKAEEGSPFAKQEEELENKKKELKRIEVEVDKKIEELNRLRAQVEKLLAQKSEEEQKRVTELAKMYEKMSADKAATVLGTVDQNLAIAILAKMKSKSAAKVLNSMDREKAAKLTTDFSTLEIR